MPSNAKRLSLSSDRARWGKRLSLEGLLSVLPWRSSAFFYRTRVGAEVYLVLEHGDGTIWAIEIKRALSAKVSRGFLVHAADDRYPVSETLEAIGIRHLMEELRQLA